MNIYYIVYVLFMYFNAAWVGWYNIIVNFIKTSCEMNIILYYYKCYLKNYSEVLLLFLYTTNSYLLLKIKEG